MDTAETGCKTAGERAQAAKTESEASAKKLTSDVAAKRSKTEDLASIISATEAGLKNGSNIETLAAPQVYPSRDGPKVVNMYSSAGHASTLGFAAARRSSQ